MTRLNPVEQEYKNGSVCKHWKAGYDKCKDLIGAFRLCFDPIFAYDGAPPTWPDIHEFLKTEAVLFMARYKSQDNAKLWRTGFDVAHKTCTDVGTFAEWQKHENEK